MARQQVICITGCSSGIGHALAERLAAAGAIVYAGVRDEARAPPLAHARSLQLDVTRPEQIASAIARIEREAGSIDVLINNAAANAIGPWELTPAEVIERIFAVNFFGVVNVTRAVLPLMRRRRSGRIVLISSLSALIPLPLTGAYSASKAALEAFGETLSYEVRPWNIQVSLLNPGGYASGLDSKSWRPMRENLGDYSPLEQQLRTPARGSAGSSEDAAERIIAAINDRSGRLRQPLDDTGRWVFRSLRLDEDIESARDSIVRKVSGLEWWFDPAKAP
ncbi:MAG TPA: SDR family oxidoreductase [Steroidobacteraceae bacterium]|nr:SDR family oxidoreductase [Steroidobacteraceae bacterium]